MSRVRKSVIWSIVGMMTLGFLYFCFNEWLIFYGYKVILPLQIRHVIHHSSAIESVSKDHATVQFLEHLPKDVKITSIQEDFDHDKTVEHFSADIDGRHVDMYVHDIGWFAMYSVSKISVDGLPTLPDLFMD